MKTRVKQQHIVPRFVIDGFSNADGYVLTFDAKEKRKFSNLPENTAKQGNIYSPVSVDGRMDLIEDLFSNIETEAAPVHQKLVGQSDISEDDRVIYSYFLAAQYVRSPKTLAATAEVVAKLQYHIAALNIQHSSDDMNLKRFVSDTQGYEIIIDQKVGLLSIGQIDQIAKFIYSYGWLVGGTADVEFITSDAPVCRLTNPNSYHPIYGDGGFTGVDTYLQFPLTPSKILLCANDVNARFDRVVLTKEGAKQLNRQTVKGAHRSLYMRDFNHRIERMISNHYVGFDAQQIATSFDAPKVIVQRKL